MNLSPLACALFNMMVNILSFEVDHCLNTATSLMNILSTHIDQVLSTIVLLITGIDYFWTSQKPPSRYIDHFWMPCSHWWKNIDLHDEYLYDNLHQSKCWSPVDRRGEHVQHVSTHLGVQKLSRFWLFLNQPSSTFIILMKIIQIICGYMALILQGSWIFMITFQ